MTTDDFLDDAALVRFTGRRQKSKQIEQLRKMGVKFFVNAAGHPMVTDEAINGRKPTKAQKPAWSPAWAASHP